MKYVHLKIRMTPNHYQVQSHSMASRLLTKSYRLSQIGLPNRSHSGLVRNQYLIQLLLYKVKLRLFYGLNFLKMANLCLFFIMNRLWIKTFHFCLYTYAVSHAKGKNLFHLLFQQDFHVKDQISK